MSTQIAVLVCENCGSRFSYDYFRGSCARKYCDKCQIIRAKERQHKCYKKRYKPSPRLKKTELILETLKRGALTSETLKRLTNSKEPKALICYLKTKKGVKIRSQVETVYYLVRDDDKE